MGRVEKLEVQKHQLVPQNPPDMNTILEISPALIESDQGIYPNHNRVQCLMLESCVRGASRETLIIPRISLSHLARHLIVIV